VIVGIADGAEVPVVGGDAVGKFVESGLADDDGARVAEFFADSGIVIRDMVGEELGAGGGENTLGIKVVLESYRDAVQRTPIAPGSEFFVTNTGGIEGGVAGDGHEGVKGRVELLDEGEGVGYQFLGRDFAGAEMGSGFEEGHH
jgi:hypothetical protein